jgi:hypothetical protein
MGVTFLLHDAPTMRGADPALDSLPERVDKLEREVAKLRRIVAELRSDQRQHQLED